MANVLSTTTRAPRSCASALTRVMSTIVSAGLVGVSTHTNAVPSGQSRSSASTSVRSATVHSMPAGASTFDTSRKVPP